MVEVYCFDTALVGAHLIYINLRMRTEGGSVCIYTEAVWYIVTLVLRVGPVSQV